MSDPGIDDERSRMTPSKGGIDMRIENWNHQQGLRATATDPSDGSDRHVGMAMSGSLYSTCEGARIPQIPSPPDADYRDALSRGIEIQARGQRDILSAALRAACAGSVAARVLLENYRHRLIESGYVDLRGDVESMVALFRRLPRSAQVVF